MIELRFTGTGALGSHRCKNKLSREYRRFPSLLIDEKIIIDPSEDLFEFEDSFMLNGITSSVKAVLVTHSHLGHLSVSAIERLASLIPNLYVFANDSVSKAISSVPNINLKTISAFEIFSVAGYEIIALPTNHVTDNAGETVLNFLIKKEKSFFYGLDGGFINPASYKVLKEIKPEVYILDCALGDGKYTEGAIYHNNLDGALSIREILINSSVATSETKFILSHLPSEKKRDIHEELSLLLEEYPSVRLAYDGYYLTL